MFGIIFFSLIYIFRFYQLQIKSFKKYEQISEGNAEQIIPLIPPRGDIFDREGNLLVTEQPAFSLFAIPALFTEKTYQELKKILPLDSEKVWKKIGRLKYYKPVKIFRQIPESSLIYILENEILFRGIDIQVEPRRRYRPDVNMSHILGILGEATSADVKEFNVEEGDIIGKKGVERTYDIELRGQKGYKFIVVDALGRVIRDNIPEKTVLPNPGKDLYLTIDLELQRYAELLMQNNRGAIVLLNVRNGEILTMVSSPGYDLSLFTGPIKNDVWASLIADSTFPLYDRALQSTYPPGSTYKIVTAIAALNENVIKPDWSVTCNGYFRLGRRTIKCWKSDGHGQLDLTGAIKNSCNVYFYQLGLKIGLDLWEKYSKMYRFGLPTGIDIYGEKGGLVPSVSYYNKLFGEGKWTKGNLANLAIGQGELLVTPLQMAQFTMILANGGHYYQPHIRYFMYDKIKKQKEYYQIKKFSLDPLRQGVYDFVREGMFQVVDDGTGRAARINNFSLAGKTGTAQNPQGDDHAWFIAYGPVDNPEVAIAVIVENGGSGGAVAAPLARELIRKYIRKYHYNP